MTRRASGLALLAALVVASAPASAAVDITRAKEHFAKAEQFYKIERFGDAFTQYQEAYLAKPDPNFLFNMGQCQRLMGNKPEAARFYRRFLKEKPETSNRLVVEKHIRDLEPPERAPPPIAAAAPVTPAAAPVAIAAPAPAPAPVAPRRAVAVLFPAAAADAPAAATAPPPMVSSLDETPPVRDTDTPRPLYKRWGFWTAVGVVVVGGLVVGAVLRQQGQEPKCEGVAICN